MKIVILIVILIIIWLVWSRLKTNKDIKKAFDLVEKDNPVLLESAFREVIGYCKRNNLKYEIFRLEFLTVEYNQKIITVQRRGNFRLGDCLFSVE